MRWNWQTTIHSLRYNKYDIRILLRWVDILRFVSSHKSMLEKDRFKTEKNTANSFINQIYLHKHNCVRGGGFLIFRSIQHNSLCRIKYNYFAEEYSIHSAFGSLSVCIMIMISILAENCQNVIRLLSWWFAQEHQHGKCNVANPFGLIILPPYRHRAMDEK